MLCRENHGWISPFDPNTKFTTHKRPVVAKSTGRLLLQSTIGPMPDLFDHAMNERMKSEAPLAARVRPRTLDEYIGQDTVCTDMWDQVKHVRSSIKGIYGDPSTGFRQAQPGGSGQAVEV